MAANGSLSKESLSILIANCAAADSAHDLGDSFTNLCDLLDKNIGAPIIPNDYWDEDAVLNNIIKNKGIIDLLDFKVFGDTKDITINNIDYLFKMKEYDGGKETAKSMFDFLNTHKSHGIAFTIDAQNVPFYEAFRKGNLAQGNQIKYIITREGINDPAGKVNLIAYDKIKTLDDECKPGRTQYQVYPAYPTDRFPSVIESFMSNFDITVSCIKKTKGVESMSTLFSNKSLKQQIDILKGKKEDAHPNAISTIMKFFDNLKGKIDAKTKSNFFIKIQQKRSGDWLQVLSCLDSRHEINPAKRLVLVTHDRICFGYALLMGVDVLYTKYKEGKRYLYFFYKNPNSDLDRLKYRLKKLRESISEPNRNFVTSKFNLSSYNILHNKLKNKRILAITEYIEINKNSAKPIPARNSEEVKNRVAGLFELCFNLIISLMLMPAIDVKIDSMTIVPQYIESGDDSKITEDNFDNAKEEYEQYLIFSNIINKLFNKIEVLGRFYSMVKSNNLKLKFKDRYEACRNMEIFGPVKSNEISFSSLFAKPSKNGEIRRGANILSFIATNMKGEFSELLEKMYTFLKDLNDDRKYQAFIKSVNLIFNDTGKTGIFDYMTSDLLETITESRNGIIESPFSDSDAKVIVSETARLESESSNIIAKIREGKEADAVDVQDKEKLAAETVEIETVSQENSWQYNTSFFNVTDFNAANVLLAERAQRHMGVEGGAAGAGENAHEIAEAKAQIEKLNNEAQQFTNEEALELAKNKKDKGPAAGAGAAGAGAAGAGAAGKGKKGRYTASGGGETQDHNSHTTFYFLLSEIGFRALDNEMPDTKLLSTLFNIIAYFYEQPQKDNRNEWYKKEYFIIHDLYRVLRNYDMTELADEVQELVEDVFLGYYGFRSIPDTYQPPDYDLNTYISMLDLNSMTSLNDREFINKTCSTMMDSIIEIVRDMEEKEMRQSLEVQVGNSKSLQKRNTRRNNRLNRQFYTNPENYSQRLSYNNPPKAVSVGGKRKTYKKKKQRRNTRRKNY